MSYCHVYNNAAPRDCSLQGYAFSVFFFFKKMGLNNLNIWYGIAPLSRLYVFIATRKDIDKSTWQLYVSSNIFFMQLHL